jgi:hypothetical protein
MASEPDLIFDLSPEKSPRLTTRNTSSQNVQEQSFSYFSDPLFFQSSLNVSNAAQRKTEVPKVENMSEQPSKPEEKQSASHNNQASFGEKLFIRTVGFGDTAVSTFTPITPSIKF